MGQSTCETVELWDNLLVKQQNYETIYVKTVELWDNLRENSRIMGQST